jgi:hypothetical protein
MIRKILLASLIYSTLANPALANNRDCIASLVNAQSTIQSGRDAFTSLRLYDIADIYQNSPQSRPYGYSLIINGSATDYILQSKQFMKAIASNIINNCPSIGLVEFEQANSSYGVPIGYFDDGSIRIFKCADENLKTHRIEWGDNMCGL